MLFPIAPIYARCILPPRGYMRRQTPTRRAHEGFAAPLTRIYPHDAHHRRRRAAAAAEVPTYRAGWRCGSVQPRITTLRSALSEKPSQQGQTDNLRTSVVTRTGEARLSAAPDGRTGHSHVRRRLHLPRPCSPHHLRWRRQSPKG